jgi:hypothetical protein
MWTRGIAGVVLCLVGAVWIGQGTNVLHGSGMSGEKQWTVIGAVLVMIGAALLTRAWKARGGRPGSPV